MSEQIKNDVKQVLTATIVALLITVLLTLIFSVVAYIFKISGSPVKITLQILKCLALFSSIMVFLRGRQGIVKGAIAGLLLTLLQSLVIAIFGGGFSSGLFSEILLLTIAGAVSGIIAVNINKSYA